MDPRSRSRLVERTAVGEGEGGEGFYVAQSGRCPDLLVIGAGGKGREDSGLLALLRIYTLSAWLTTCHGPGEGISNPAQKLGTLDGQGGKRKGAE